MQEQQKLPDFLVSDSDTESGQPDAALKRKRILFVLQYPGYLRYFDSVLDALAVRGHHVMLSFDNPRKQREGLVGLDGACDAIEVVRAVPQRKDRYQQIARGLRTMVDYARYLHPDYANCGYLRDRMGSVLPPAVRFMRRLPMLGERSTNLLTRSLARLEQGIPSSAEVEALLRELKPDAVVVTPLVTDGSTQVDVVKSARQLGIRTALCVASWDHLTTKGLIRLHPDLVFVWNELQKREAVKYHHVAGSTVCITGAHPFDKWFDWKPSTTRNEFCKKVGLSGEKPFILFVGSTASISAPEAEVEFVLGWIRGLRSAEDAAVREAAVLIRPHPYNPGSWGEVDLSGLGDVAVWPTDGANPVDRADRADYFDSLHHCVAVIGVNTTAMVEAAILDRPVHTIRTSDFRDTQGGTLHFRYLLEENGGFVRAADHSDEHHSQLAESLADPLSAHARNAAFIRSFIRPHGIDTPCTPILARQLEMLANSHVKPRRAVPRRYAPLKAVFSVLGERASASRRSDPPRDAAPKVRRSPRETALKALSYVVRRKRVRAFLRAYVIPRIAPDQMAFKEMAVAERQIQRLAPRRKDKIIVGPWLSEVGFEVLYWIPFLNWAKTYRHFDPDRLVVLSRGGVAPWYATLTNNYLDILDFMTPQDYVRANEARMLKGKQKQRTISDFDRDILRIARQELKQKDAEVLHPSTMYNLFWPYWKRRATVNLIDQFAEFSKFKQLDCSDIADQLPENYIAARFYFNDSFPDTEQNRLFVAQLLSRLTQRHDVVLLNPGFAMDDHWDFRPEGLDRVHTIEDLMTPSTNLEVQTKVISRADAFVGTYGGLSYLPPFYGVNSLAIYSNRQGFMYHHFELANHIFMRLNEASFIPLDVRDTDLINKLTGDDLFPVAPLRERLKQTVLVGRRSLDTDRAIQGPAEAR